MESVEIELGDGRKTCRKDSFREEDRRRRIHEEYVLETEVDKDVQDRGKIGRTKNTDIKRLKTRYSIFGNPDILCHWSTDIQKDENTLKKLMRDAGCMESHKEMIFNIKIARRVFYEFIEM